MKTSGTIPVSLRNYAEPLSSRLVQLKTAVMYNGELQARGSGNDTICDLLLAQK